MTIREAKRRVTWLWRLAASDISLEQKGTIPALWIFDTINEPDGAVLRPFVMKVAAKENLRLFSFGPRNARGLGIVKACLRFLREIALLPSSAFDDELSNRVRNALRHAGQAPSVLLFGAYGGTFAAAAQQMNKSIQAWEIQHGALDSSYFPMKVERFYARSDQSAAIIKSVSPDVSVEVISQCLRPPKGKVMPLANVRVDEIVCYSKNPGGGCNTEELSEFERGSRSAAKALALPFTLWLHPRDNYWKLVLRHRRFEPLLWVAFARLRRNKTGRRLAISAYSTALVTNSKPGDALLNVDIGTPSDIARREYSWVPKIAPSSLPELSREVEVFLRA